MILTLIRVLTCGFLSAFVALIVILKIVQPIVAKDAVETQSKLKTEYTWYYNGEEVDSDKIDLSLYDYTVNDEKRIVYIAEKRPVIYKRETILPFCYWEY